MKHLLIGALILFSGWNLLAQSASAAIATWQAEMNESYGQRASSPLTPEDFEHFQGLPFFPIDTNYIVQATLVRTPDAQPFEMATTTARKPIYVMYGKLHFTLRGQACVLPVYQSQDLQSKPGYEDYLFLPFSDLTTGATSYGGGRYLDLRIPAGDNVTIDFNRAYNPYCAYNERYSCPRIPAGNHLEVAIEAGVMKPADH
jgi:uncharacterized protein (DUF1684 family)